MSILYGYGKKITLLVSTMSMQEMREYIPVINLIRDRQNEKIVWRIEEMEKMEKMDKIEKRDKVVTRTGGLAHDRNRTYSEIQKQNDSKTQ
jgi:hypothetical protein